MERHAPIAGETQDIYLQTGSAAMGELIQAAHRAAVSPATVLLTGERGVGKNTLARQIHEWSSWRQHSFVVIDCAVLSAKLSQHASFDDILLSLVRSSGVNEPRLVLTGAATIVFDNISKLCHLGQVRLSQFIEEHAPSANLTGDAEGPSLRLLATSTSGLAAAVAAHRFREDLFLQINEVNLEIPPLRERPEDILPLAQHMLYQASEDSRTSPSHFSPEAIAALILYRWPRNVRELRDTIKHALAQGDGGTSVTLLQLPYAIAAARWSTMTKDDFQPLISLEEMERRHIARVLIETGSLERAASTLGINPSTLWRKRRRYNLTSLPPKSNTA
jgi:NtrC-family two-component system response regulator AlgB